MYPFVHLEELQLLICTRCRHAVLSQQSETHLRTKHKNLSKDERTAIVQAVSQLPVLKKDTDRELYKLPSLPIPAIQHLDGPYNDGLRCHMCRFIARTHQTMKIHCAKKHQWVNPSGHGGDTRKKKDQLYDFPWTTNVWCQRCFKGGTGSSWFEVVVDQAAQQKVTLTQQHEEVQNDFLETIRREYKELTKGTTSIIGDNDGKTEPNPWLSRVGWARHFETYETQWVRKMASQNTEVGWGAKDCTRKAAMLQAVYDSLKRIAWQAKEDCTDGDVGLSVLLEVGRKTVTDHPNRPFSGRIERRTMERYISVWQRILAYIFRTIDMDDERRPAYDFTSKQKGLFDNVRRQLRGIIYRKEEPSRLDRTLLDFLVSLLDHPLGDGDYESAILSALAAMGVRDDGGWYQADNYTWIYSAVIKLARMFVVRQSVLEEDEDTSSENSVYSIVRQKVARFMTLTHSDSQPSPMGWMFLTRSYGLKVQYDSAVQGGISWSGEHITYRAHSFTMCGLVDMMHNLVQEMEDVLDWLTFKEDGVQPPYVKLPCLRDDAGNDTPGFSFLKDPRNQNDLDGLTFYLMGEVVQNPDINVRFFHPQTTPLRFRIAPAEAYLRKVDEFRELLLILTYLLSGQPARTTELLGLRYANTSYGGTRNVVIHDSMVSLVFFYHKGYSNSRQVKVIHRYLPYEIGALFIRYLTVVLPFVTQLSKQVYEISEANPFIWHRQARSRTPTQGGTTTIDNIWSSDKMRNALQKYSERHLGTKLDISSWRHIAIAVGRKYLWQQFTSLGLTKMSYGDDETDDDNDDDILDLQAGHSTHIGHTIYGRTIEQGTYGTASKQEKYRELSTAWHGLFHFAGTKQKGKKIPVLKQVDQQRRDIRQARLDRLRQVDLEGRLQQLVRRLDATFRGNQREAVEAVVRGSTPILQISSTGVGKTMTFMLPAYANDHNGTTIVIVPFVALQQDISVRCCASAITCCIWSEHEASTASIVLVSPESFVTKRFQDFVNRLIERSQLDRIVFDECHTILDASSSFRPELRTIGSSLARPGVQLVFLTATLPPRDEAEFWLLLHLDPRRAVIVRGSTSRPNITYSVHFADDQDDLDSTIERLCTLCQPTPGTAGPARTIIYCQQRLLADKLAEKLDCASYHSQSGDGDRDVRNSIVQQWIETSGPIVATSALGAGIDIPDVRQVIHYGLPRTLRDFVQESGRAGRDSHPAFSTICMVQLRISNPRALSAHRAEDITEYVQNTIECRRTILDRVMDGCVSRVQCKDDESPCDLCKATSTPEPEVDEMDVGDEGLYDAGYIARAGAERVREIARHVVRFERSLEWLHAHCLVCTMVEAPNRHPTTLDCVSGLHDNPDLVLQQVTEAYGFVKEILKSMGSFSCCFDCGIPQELCERWVAAEADEGSRVRDDSRRCTYGMTFCRCLAIFEVFDTDPDETIRQLCTYIRGLGYRVEDDVSLMFLFTMTVRWGRLQVSGLCIGLWIHVRRNKEKFLSRV
jgi:superfamily II DNA or RNA helicase